MSENLKECPVCNDVFKWNQDVCYVENTEKYYHESCIEVYPTGYFAMLDGEPLGDVEDAPEWAMSVLDDGEYDWEIEERES